jgi:hypothetical protein
MTTSDEVNGVFARRFMSAAELYSTNRHLTESTANCTLRIRHAVVVELVDTLASGASGGNPVEVQVLSSAPDSPFASRKTNQDS